MIGGHLTWNPPTIRTRETGWAVYRDGRMVAATMLGHEHAVELLELCRSWQPHVPASRWSIRRVVL